MPVRAMSQDAVSANQYVPQSFEARHRMRWEEAGLHKAKGPASGKPKYYVLDMFPYPSGSGLHVGHALGYVGTDIVSRKKRMEGFDVLHPMGWDAFGLPAEQYAIQTGRHPRSTTDENTANFRRQLQNIGLSYDWSREVDTSHASYYKHTQKLFKVLYEQGLAYRAEVPVWWCEELKTVLANEEVINGRSERGNYPCVRRPLKQWMLKITAYADRLLADLDLLDWPESIKVQQREWIGRSEGASVRFRLEAGGEVEVYTTRPDTLWGATFMVLAPEHPLVAQLTTPAQRAAVEAYALAAKSKSELERTELAKDKTGVATGAYALNPLLDPNDPRARIPIWIADYVLWGYGTGAIMAVPGHDERDFEFAQKFGLAVREVVRPPQGTKGLADGECFSGEGTAIHSGPLDGLTTSAAKAKAIELLVAQGCGAKKVTYKLRDWLFSRQRYWGEPFPLIHLEDGTVVLLPDDALPVLLPDMDDFKPSQDGSAPLARAKEWVETRDPRTGATARRDTDTMPGWAGSCWYWLRFMDTANTTQPFSSEAENYWGPVDLYVGGASHAVMHLLYARFWHKVFYDAGLVHTKEPFQELFNQGMVTAYAYEDATGRLVASDEVETKGDVWVRKGTGEPLQQIVTKMAKSLKNVVNPDDIIAEYGCDTFRLYEMFMGPLADSKPWNTRDIPGCRRFLERLWRVCVDEKSTDSVRPNLLTATTAELQGESLQLERSLAKTLVRVEESFTHFNFNVAIAAFMSFVNDATKAPQAVTRSQAQRLLAALSPFAPHIAEELWHRLGADGLCAAQAWPKPDMRYAVDDEIDLPVQVNGKLRATPKAPKDADKAGLEAVARAAVAAHLEGKEILKVVIVPGRLVNFVIKG